MKKFISLVLALVMALSLTTVAWGAGNVAKIGDVEYATLQAAIDAAVNGDTITLLADCDENVTVVQALDVAITIDGANKTYTGTITVDGKSAAYPTAALKIQNVNFDATSITKDACINMGGTNAMRYISNLTVTGCTFSYSGSGDVVAVKSYTGGDKNLTIEGCIVNSGMHSLLQVKNVETGVKITGCKVYSKEGINLNSTPALEMSSCEFDVQGYAVRVGVNGTVNTTEKSFTITDSTLKSACADGDAVIVFRDDAKKADVTITDTTLTGTTTFAGNTGVTEITVDGVPTDAVAQVGSDYYETVADAIAAANGAPVVLLDPSATIPAGYTVATDLNGNLVVLAGTNVPASAAKGAYYTTDMTTLVVYPGCDLTNYKYALEHYTNGAAAAKTFDQKVIWKTDKVTGAKTIDGVYVVAASSESADLAFVNGSQITYLSNVAAYTGTVTALPTVDAKDAAKCGDMFVGGDYAAYTDANAKMYVEKAGGTVYNAGGKYVELVEVTPNTTYIVDTLLANPAGYAPYTLYIVSHEYGVDYKTVATKTEVTNVYCKECKATFAFVEGTKADAVKKFGAGNYIDFGAGLFVAKVANGSVVTPSTDKVTSAETFDAGIAMYVGMSVMAAAGSAVVLKKRED